MKRPCQKPALIAAGLIVTYLLGLLVCVFAIGMYPVYFQQKPILSSSARKFADLYREDPESALHQIIASDVIRLFYDVDGRLTMRVVSETAFPGTDPGNAPEKYLPAVLSGRTVYRFLLNVEENDLLMLFGTPITSEETITGALFQVKNLKNLPEALEGMAVCFTAIYWIAAYFVVTSAAKKRKLEEIQQNYIANVTHALKTPGASIRTLAEALCDGVVTDPNRQRMYYGQILQETIRQSRMVQQILELSKLQSGGYDFTKAAVSAADIFEPIIARYTAIYDCAGVTLHVAEEISRLPLLHTNAGYIQQVLEILLDNAIKFVPEGGETWIGAGVSKGCAIICVRDNGIGISKEDLPFVFERFYRCKCSDAVSGSGLGLAIAQEMINGLKEKIWVESTLEEGAAFFFTVHFK